MRLLLFCCLLLCAAIHCPPVFAVTAHLRNALTDISLTRTTPAVSATAPMTYVLGKVPAQAEGRMPSVLPENQKFRRGKTLLIVGASFLLAAAILIPAGIGVYENNAHNDAAVGGILMAGLGVVLAWTGIGLSIPGLIMTLRYRK